MDTNGTSVEQLIVNYTFDTKPTTEWFADPHSIVNIDGLLGIIVLVFSVMNFTLEIAYGVAFSTRGPRFIKY